MNKKIEEILKKTSPPSEIDESKKHQLRRELLNSKRYQKNKFSIGVKYVLPGFVAAVIAVFVIVTLINQPITLDELRQKVNTQYAGFAQPASLASFQNDLSLYGTDNEKVKLKLEQVYDPSSKNYHVIVFDEQKLEELDQLIIKDNELYRTENPKIKTIGTLSALSQKKLQVFILDDSSNIPAELKFLGSQQNGNQFISHRSKNGYLVYQKPVAVGGEIPSYKSEQFYKEIPHEVDVDKYFRANPVDLAEEINESSDAELLTGEIDEEYSEKLQVIRIKRDFNESLASAYKVVLNKIDSLKLIDVSTSVSDTAQKKNLGRSIKWSFTNGDSLKSYKELKTILVSAETGEIKEVRFAVQKDDIKINLSEVKFREQSVIPANQSKFDPQKHNLVYVGKLN